MKKVDEEKKNEELKTRMLCKELNCDGKVKNYRGMKTHYAKKHKDLKISEELLFKIKKL